MNPPSSSLCMKQWVSDKQGSIDVSKKNSCRIKIWVNTVFLALTAHIW